MSTRQIKILPMRMSDEGPRLKLPGCTSLPLSPDELRKVIAVVEAELRTQGETWARLMSSKATPPDITFTRGDVDLADILGAIEGEPADMVRVGGNPRSALTPR